MRSARQNLLERVRPKLVCPPLATGGRFDFGGLSDAEEKADWLSSAKGAAKRRLGRFYPLAIDVLAPVYGSSGVTRFVEEGVAAGELVVDLGSGTRDYEDRVVCVDGYAYPGVHVVCDLGRLPFADGSIDRVLSQAVLEHVPDPEAHVAEIRRVLRPGGRVLCFFPFLQAFHAAPHDYSRRTLPGLAKLFEDFTIDAERVAGGPTSGLLWTLQEWLAIAGSFGSERLYRLLVPLTWTLSPLKYLDLVLAKHPAAHVIASGFEIEATKPG